MNRLETTFGPVFAGEDALLQLNAALEAQKEAGNLVFFLVDENTHENCLSRLIPELPGLGKYELLEVPAGEETKTVDIAAQLWSALNELGADRNSMLVNVGGGMITDLGGFVASTFKRGIPFLHVPTSLLAMVDASLGGKCGVDVGGIKNLVGSFSPASGVFLIPDFLETLPERDLKSGMAEMAKHGLITSMKHFYSVVEANPKRLYEDGDLLRDSMRIKMDVVNQDPHESGLRKTLNFGHTLGHAVESHFLETSNPLLHGEAIWIGMWLETQLSSKLGFLSEEEALPILSNLRKWAPNQPLPAFPALEAWMVYDKKNTGSVIKFALLKHPGEATWDCVCSQQQITEVVEAWNDSIL